MLSHFNRIALCAIELITNLIFERCEVNIDLKSLVRTNKQQAIWILKDIRNHTIHIYVIGYYKSVLIFYLAEPIVESLFRMTVFLRNFLWQFYFILEFLPEVCWEKVDEDVRVRQITFFWKCFIKKLINIFLNFFCNLKVKSFRLIVGNNFIQMSGHSVAYMTGTIFKHIIECVHLYFNGFINIAL